MASFDDYLGIVPHWATKHRADLEVIAKSSWLSPEGKALKKAESEERYRFNIARVRSDAAADFKHDRELAAAKLSSVRADAAESERSLLGQDIAFRLLERQIDGASAVQVLSALTDARDEWEKAVIARLGAYRLSTLEAGPIGTDEFRARGEFTWLAQAAADPKEQAIADEIATADRDLDNLDRLDPITYENNLRERFNLARFAADTPPSSA